MFWPASLQETLSPGSMSAGLPHYADMLMDNSDWFRLETMDDSFQPTIDLLLNVAIFAWFGAICPWHMFVANNVIPIYRLIPLGILVLLFRRPPIVLAMHKFIPQIEEWRQAFFVGYFGPIGVSAIFYLYTSRELLERITVNGRQREDVARLEEVFTVVVWFMTICSIVGHGLSIPLGKVGWYLPRTLSSMGSRSMSRTSSEDPDEPRAPFRIGRHPVNSTSVEVGPTSNRPHQIFRIGGTVIRDPRGRSTSKKGSRSRDTSGIQTPKERTGQNNVVTPSRQRQDRYEEDTERREQDIQAGEQGHEQAVQAARLGRMPTPEDSPSGTEHQATPPASPGVTNRSITWAALSGAAGGGNSYSRSQTDLSEAKKRRNKKKISKRDIRILGARPMGRGSVSGVSGAEEGAEEGDGDIGVSRSSQLSSENVYDANFRDGHEARDQRNAEADDSNREGSHSTA